MCTYVLRGPVCFLRLGPTSVGPVCVLRLGPTSVGPVCVLRLGPTSVGPVVIDVILKILYNICSIGPNTS